MRQLDAWGIGLIDCQVHTDHLERFGGYEIPRQDYLDMLGIALDEPTRRGRWAFEMSLDEFAATGGMMGLPEPEPRVTERVPRRELKKSAG